MMKQCLFLVSATRWCASRQLVSVALTCIGSVREALEMQSWISHLYWDMNLPERQKLVSVWPSTRRSPAGNASFAKKGILTYAHRSYLLATTNRMVGCVSGWPGMKKACFSFQIHSHMLTARCWNRLG